MCCRKNNELQEKLATTCFAHDGKDNMLCAMKPGSRKQLLGMMNVFSIFIRPTTVWYVCFAMASMRVAFAYKLSLLQGNVPFPSILIL